MHGSADDLRGKQVALQEAWRAKKQKFAELPYGPGDIVHFEKATFASNRDRDYVVIKTDVDHLWVRAGEHPYRFTHEEAEGVGVTVVREATS
jgi:hypothetical protein